MRPYEIFARITVVFIFLGLPLATFGYQHILRPMAHAHRVIDIQAWAPEAGGFSPAVIRINVGETVTLRFTSMDVTHGVAIGPGLDADLGYIDPGEQGEITLTFDEVGKYTYYCTTWCSIDHWRMRGIIEVVDPLHPNAPPQAQSDPVIQALVEAGVNIDANHMGESHGEAHEEKAEAFPIRPSATRGERLATAAVIPPQLYDAGWRQSHTPNDAIAHLRTANPALLLNDLRDIAAYLWTVELSVQPETIRQYELNCAACHGETGHAEGPAAPFTADTTSAFADPAYMFTMRSDVLYAKIRRGGMGTDMPNFGTLFTQEESWALVEYLWQLAFESDADEATH